MDFKSNAKDYLQEFDKQMKKAVEMIGGIIEGAAKDLAPVDTGLLRNSITHGGAGGKLGAASYASDDGSVTGEYADSSIPEDADGAKYVVVVGTNVGYAVYQELGTAHMAPQPFLRPAFEGSIGTAKTVLETLLKG